METQTKLSAQEIKTNMTTGQWNISDNDIVAVYHKIGTLQGIFNAQMGKFEHNNNGAAICNSINNTYGKNINPEAVPELLRMLKCFVDVIDMIADSKGVMEERTREVYVTIQQSETYIQSRAAIEKATI